MAGQIEDPQISKWVEEFRKGHIRLAILLLLQRAPLYGYSIMKQISELTCGVWKPTPGGIYPVLKKLESYGLVEGFWEVKAGRRRRLYRITDKGVGTFDKMMKSYRDFSSWVNILLKELSLPANGEELVDEMRDSAFLLGERRRLVMSLMSKLESTLNEIDSKLKELREQVRLLDRSAATRYQNVIKDQAKRK